MQYTNFQWLNAIRDDRRLEPNTKFVLMMLFTYMDKNGKHCFPSQETIAEATGLSRPTVIKHLGIADQRGWIKRKKHRAANGYWYYGYEAVLNDLTLPKRSNPNDSNPCKTVRDPCKTDAESMLNDLTPPTVNYSNRTTQSLRHTSMTRFLELSKTRQICKIEEDFKRQPGERQWFTATHEMKAMLEQIMDQCSDELEISGHAERVLSAIELSTKT